MDALARIKDKVARTPKGDASYLLNKGAKYKGRVNPVLSEEELVAFERKQRVTLPEEYRSLLLEVGNGGLGPNDGLGTLAESVGKSPTADLNRPFPICFRLYAEGLARFGEDIRTRSVEEAVSRSMERHGGVPPQKRPEMDYAQPGVLYLATPDPPWASVYLVISGEDRGTVWMYGFECGWNPEAPTWAEDERQIGKPPRTFLRWYEDWLDEILAK